MKCRDVQRKGNNNRAHVSVGKENNLVALGGFFPLCTLLIEQQFLVRQ